MVKYTWTHKWTTLGNEKLLKEIASFILFTVYHKNNMQQQKKNIPNNEKKKLYFLNEITF